MNSFRNRLLVLIIGLVIATQTVTLIAVLARTAGNVQARSAEQLRSGGRFAQQLIRFRAGQLANGIAVLAADFGFREAVAGGEPLTILSAARNHSQRLGADLLLLLDTHGKVITSTATDGPRVGSPLGWALDEANDARDQPHFIVLGQRSYQYFLAPVRAPDTIAWVLMGFAVDDSLAQRIRDLVGVEVSLLAYGHDRIAHIASTLPLGQRAELARAEVMRATGGSARLLQLGGTEYLSFAQPLDASGSIDVILQKPMHEVLAPYRDVRDALLWIGGVALALAVVVGLRLGRAASNPIGQLVHAARRIQDGQYDTAVAVGGGDEFRSLAATFNAMQRGIAEREARITHQLYHDPLTGLPNGALAARHLEELLSRGGRNQRIAIVAIDLRNMSEINASLGQHVGDAALREAAQRLRQNLPANDLVARLEGAQYLIIANDCTFERAPLLAGQLTGVLRTAFHAADVSLDLHVRAGICNFPEHGDTAGELLQRARLALEDSAESRTHLAGYRPGSDQEYRRRLALLADLRSALEHSGLMLVYQPKVAMATRSVRSLEALVRWHHPELGAISPGEFVPLAERMGISRRLTSWVLNAAIQQMARWRDAGLEIEVAVNLSAPDILDAGLADEILALLRVHRVAPTALALEITESAVMRDAPLAARNMRLLQVAGVRFAIDDFGTGYSSLSHLSRLPVDELKIDRSFITQAHLRSEDVTIVAAIVELGHSMGLKVVAEGVEQPQTWNLLRRLGCDYAQGYLVSRPLAVADVAPFVQRANQLLSGSDSTLLQIKALEQLGAG